MTDSAPWRRPMMFSKLASAASEPGAALAWPVKCSLAAAHWPLPSSSRAPLCVDSVSEVASARAASPLTLRR